MACLVLPLAGCGSLPSSGPTAHEIVKAAEAESPDLRFRIVDLDAAAVAALNRADLQQQAAVATLMTLASNRRADLVGPGDVLAISIYEVGVSLFSGGGPRSVGAGFDPSAHGENFPAVVVNEKGEIDLPYLGPLYVAGLTTDQVEQQIRQGLLGKSQDPQALVEIRQNISNTVFVSGDVHKPGRLDLTLGRERLLDAIALAGGATNTSDDTVVRFSRGGRSLEERLSTIPSGSPDDLVLIPGDRVELIKRPRSYIVFGAAGRVSQVSFETGGVSLAEAVARVGGPNDAAADASAVFLFRYDAKEQSGGDATPVIYRLNLLNPTSYFLAQRFAMRDKDVVYVANAGINRTAKLVAIINQLFTPFITARQLTPGSIP